MKKRGIIRHPQALAAVVALVAAGCILSGQFVIVFNIEDVIAYVNQTLSAAEIDLSGDKTWIEHKDEIQNIVDVKFKLTIENSANKEITGDVFVSPTLLPDVDAVRDSAILVITGIAVPADSSRSISFAESTSFIRNLDALRDLVKDGRFFLYGLAHDPPFELTIPSGARLLVTFSAGSSSS